MNKNIIVAKDISMNFYTSNTITRVLQKVNLTIEKGKLTMIVGPSGCGKTTLISILTAILTASKGRVKFNGTDVSKMSNSKKTLLRQKKIGFIFQQYNLINTLSIAENVAIPLLAANIKYEVAKKRSIRILQTLGIGDDANQKPENLSGGEKQRVAIARALVHNPEFLVCDEPTSSLDEKNGQKILKILKKISQNSDKAVLIVTHDNRIFNYADLIIYMNDGRIVEQTSKLKQY